MRSIPVRRNTLVLFVVVFLLAVFGWAGWANWEWRQQQAERRAALAAAQGTLIPVSSDGGDTVHFTTPLEGKPAPAFTLDDLNGKKISLANFRGKPLLINFWATWCTPCMEETPWLVELRNKYAAQGFEVIGIDSEGDDAEPGSSAFQKDEAAIEKFVQREKVPYPVLLDGDSISKNFGGVEDLPTSFFVDRKGKIVASLVGINSESDIEADIKKAMAE